MIRESSIDELSALTYRVRKSDETDRFIRETVDEFRGSGYDVAEITGFPGGEPDSARAVSAWATRFRNRIRAGSGVSITQRKNKLFIIREELKDDSRIS